MCSCFNCLAQAGKLHTLITQVRSNLVDKKRDSQHCHCHLVLSVHSLSYNFCLVLLLLVQLLIGKLSRAWLLWTHHLQQLDPIKSTDTRSQKTSPITYKIFNSSVNITSKSQQTLQSKHNQYLCFVFTTYVY